MPGTLPPVAVLAPKSLLRRLVPVVLVAFSIRLIVVFFTYRDLPDADKFYEAFGWEMGWIARALATGHGFSSPYWPWSGPTANQPPLYPALLSLVFRVFGVYSLTSGFIILSINSLFSSLTCIAVYFSAKCSLGARSARIAAWVWAALSLCHLLLRRPCLGVLAHQPPLHHQLLHRAAHPSHRQSVRMDGMGSARRPHRALQPRHALHTAVPRRHRAWQLRKAKPGRRWLLNFVLTGVAAAAVLAPWTIRTYRAVGILCPVRDNFWLEVYDENTGDDALDPSLAHPDTNAHPASNPTAMHKYLTLGEKAYPRREACPRCRLHPRSSRLRGPQDLAPRLLLLDRLLEYVRSGTARAAL